MAQIYHKGQYFGGGESSSKILEDLKNLSDQIEELQAQKQEILQQLKELNEKETNLNNSLSEALTSISNLQSTDSNFNTQLQGIVSELATKLTSANITRNTTLTESGKYALDAIERNAGIDGTFANSIQKAAYKAVSNEFLAVQRIYTTETTIVDAMTFKPQLSINAGTNLNTNSVASIVFHNAGVNTGVLFFGKDHKLHFRTQQTGEHIINMTQV